VTRDEAAAKANYEAVTGRPWENAGARAAKLCREDSAAIIAALDAHDAAHNVHRVVIDDATVERAARALDEMRANPATTLDYLSSEKVARAVLSAATQEGES